MSREEAIAYFKRHIDLYCVTGICREAEEMAIQALEQEPSGDAISRQAAIDAANKVIERDTSGNNDVVNAMIAWSAYIKSLPPVKPQERTGHWNLFHTTEHGIREDSYFKCNRCNYESYKEYNFCPDCGARMEVEK